MNGKDNEKRSGAENSSGVVPPSPRLWRTREYWSDEKAGMMIPRITPISANFLKGMITGKPQPVIPISGLAHWQGRVNLAGLSEICSSVNFLSRPMKLSIRFLGLVSFGCAALGLVAMAQESKAARLHGMLAKMDADPERWGSVTRNERGEVVSLRLHGAFLAETNVALLTNLDS